MSYFKVLVLSLVGSAGSVAWLSNSWTVLWFLMEVSFLVFVSCFSFSINYSFCESVIKYILVQVFLSLGLLCFLIMCYFNLSGDVGLIVLLLIFGKAGLFPFHFWLVSLLGKLNWLTFFVLESFVKLVPLCMLFNVVSVINFTVCFCITGVGGALLGFGQLSVQKVLGYSSMINFCWLALGLLKGFFFFFFFLIMYYFTVFVFCLFFSSCGVYYIRQMGLFSLGFFFSFINFMYFFMVSSFPPFITFLMKWVVVCFLFSFDLGFFVWCMFISSYISVFFYFMIFYDLLFVNVFFVKWFLFYNLGKFILFFILALLSSVFIYLLF